MIEEAVLTIVSHVFDVEKDMIPLRSSKSKYVRARAAYVGIMTQRTKISLTDIGKKIDCSHDVIINYRRKSKVLQLEDIDFEVRLMLCLHHLSKYVTMKRRKIKNGQVSVRDKNYLKALVMRS